MSAIDPLVSVDFRDPITIGSLQMVKALCRLNPSIPEGMTREEFAARCVDIAISGTIELCAQAAESEPALPGSPWKALGFWKAFRLLRAKLRHPFREARAECEMMRAAIAKRIRARTP